MMLPSLQAKIDKANAYNAKLKSNPKFAKKIHDKMKSSEGFKSDAEREAWLEQREAAKWASVSW